MIWSTKPCHPQSSIPGPLKSTKLWVSLRTTCSVQREILPCWFAFVLKLFKSWTVFVNIPLHSYLNYSTSYLRIKDILRTLFLVLLLWNIRRGALPVWKELNSNLRKSKIPGTVAKILTLVLIKLLDKSTKTITMVLFPRAT